MTTNTDTLPSSVPVCRHCGYVVDTDGLSVPDPLDGRPMHIQCRLDILERGGTKHENARSGSTRKE